MRLVHEDDEIVGEVVDERERVRALRPPLEMARVVLDARAEAELLQHLEVVLGALPQPVRLEHLPLRVELRHLLLELGADLVHGPLDRRRRRHVLRGRPDDEVLERREHLAGERVEVRDRLHLVTEERDAVCRLRIRGLHLHQVALHAEATTAEHRVVADVLALDELAERGVAVVRLPHLEDQHALLPLLRRAEAVDAGDGRDDDDVPPRHQRRRGGEPQARDVVVLGRVLLDIEVGLGHVRLGLVVVVVRDEVLDGVLGEELAELVAELRGKRLVVRDDERRLPDLLDRPRHGRRLARAGRAQQRLEAAAAGDALCQQSRWLPAGRPLGDRRRTCGTRPRSKRSRLGLWRPVVAVKYCERDLAGRLRLVLRVAVVRLDDARPEARALFGRRPARS